jgi:hypothetical protein
MTLLKRSNGDHLTSMKSGQSQFFVSKHECYGIYPHTFNLCPMPHAIQSPVFHTRFVMKLSDFKSLFAKAQSSAAL